ncbi:MAG: 50S ribosomal protein L13 [archaeon]|jgi:large subunit ribosomal protein L13
MIVNAEGLVAGRLASKVAKAAINGEDVVIINAEKVVLVGKQTAIMPKFKQRVEAAVKSNPHYGPKYDRIPSKMLRRMIKGMLPNKSRTAEKLLKQISIYNLTTEKVDTTKAITIEEIKCNQKHDFMLLGDVAKALGGKW